MRSFRHLTFSNAIAVIALFVALGGAAYAGTKLNGKNIVNKSIGGGKLKNETITANKIKKGTITGAQIKEGSIDSTTINVSTLATVPSAQTAATATTAQTATTATNATQAKTAVTAGEADTATTADNAKHAGEADTATTAATATNAIHADTADDADTIEGESATELRAELKVTCSTTTEFYGGMCWDKTPQPAVDWLVAVSDCGDRGGRLPSIGELIAYVLQPGVQVLGQTWSSDVVDLSGSEEEVLTSNETTRGTSKSGLFGYRCVFPRAN